MAWRPKEIPIVSPIMTQNVHSSGRTMPIQMRCQHNTGTEDYIVKLWNNVELKEHSLAREIYGSLLADYFGLATPDVAVVEIPDDFFQYEEDTQKRLVLQNSTGFNFGSKYVRGSMIYSPPLTPNLIASAIRVFCFDMFIGNIDRRYPKVNMFQSTNGFIVFDHEQAFPFSRPNMYIGGFPKGCDFIREAWSHDHILFASLKKRDLLEEIENFLIDLGKLNNQIFATIESMIPSQWQSDLDKITNYLVETRDNSQDFKRNLQELLA